MTDDPHLLQAVLAEPEDDAVRLVYADWLEENGQPGRAEFIRVQCELARIGSLHPPADDEDRAIIRRAKALRHREQELKDTLRLPLWDGERPGEAAGVGANFRRGFVESVVLPTAAFVGGPCGRCGGRKRVQVADADELRRMNDRCEYPLVPPRKRVDCPDCHGTGRTPGHATVLFRSQPIREVRLTGKRPVLFGWGRAAWFHESVPGDHPEAALPGGLFGLLENHEQDSRLGTTRCKIHPSPDAALSALSAACVAFGRAEAAENPLPTPLSR